MQTVAQEIQSNSGKKLEYVQQGIIPGLQRDESKYQMTYFSVYDLNLRQQLLLLIRTKVLITAQSHLKVTSDSQWHHKNSVLPMCDKQAFKFAHLQKFICLGPNREAFGILIIPHVKENVTPADFVLFHCVLSPCTFPGLCYERLQGDRICSYSL